MISAPITADGDDHEHVPALLLRDHDHARDHHPEEGDLDEELPPEVHELVVAQPRQRRPQPHGAEQQDDDLEHEPEDGHDPGVEPAVGGEEAEPGAAGPAEEQRHRDRAHRDHVHELGEEEDREADARVLGVEAADELLLGLDQVERRVVRLGDRGDHEDHERARWRAASTSRRSRSTRCRPSPAASTMPRVESVSECTSTPTIARPNAAS